MHPSEKGSRKEQMAKLVLPIDAVMVLGAIGLAFAGKLTEHLVTILTHFITATMTVYGSFAVANAVEHHSQKGAADA